MVRTLIVINELIWVENIVTRPVLSRMEQLPVEDGRAGEPERRGCESIVALELCAGGV